ncbi:MAG: hypothetical protein BWY74_02887 [Firmicutes bacterium ADurb.Bin419]|nr:MAG: hypothetical protein BWY74_02887 [Firmicutes bacterium ADurb.Bin419]
MEGLAKSAPSSTPATVNISKESPAISAYMVDGVPVEMYEYFGLNLGNVETQDKAKLKDIFDYLIPTSKNMSDAFSKLTDIQLRLGSSSYEKRHDKIWNFIKINKQIEELQRRQIALR